MRGEPGSLKGDGHVDIADPPAFFLQDGHDFPQKDLAVNAFPFVGGVGEKVADIPEGQRPEEGVAKGVDGDIAVRMGHEARFRRDADPAQPHRQPFCEGMHVVSVSDSDFHSHKGNEKMLNFVS